MLRLTLKLGDDLYFGLKGQDHESYAQVIMNSLDDGDVKILTPKEIVFVPVDASSFTELGILGVKVSIVDNEVVPGSYFMTLDMENEVSVLRGRLYRRSIDE